ADIFMEALSNSQTPFNLKASDFKTESTTATVTATWLSPEFLTMLPKPPKNITQKSTVNSKTCKAVVQLFGKTVDVTFDPTEIVGDLHYFIQQINAQLNWTANNKMIIDDAIVADLLELK